MNPAAALSRSASGKHLSFRSNLHGIDHLLTAPSPNSGRKGVRRLTESLSFGSPLNYTEKCGSNCILSEGQFGFDYAKERLEKRQMFLRSYRFTSEAKEASRNSCSKLSQKVGGCLFRIRAALWTVIACNPPHADGHNGFVRLHRHTNPLSSQFGGSMRW